MSHDSKSDKQNFHSELLDFIASDESKFAALIQDSIKASVFSRQECTAILTEANKLVATLGNANYASVQAFIDQALELVRVKKVNSDVT